MLDKAQISLSDRYAGPYFEVFLLSMVIIWLPYKGLAYAVPFLAILWFIFRSNSGVTLLRFAFHVALFLVVTACYFLFYYIIEEQFILQNAFIFFVTYGSFLFLLTIPVNVALHKKNYESYIVVIRIAVAVEATLGLTQVILYVIRTGANFDSSTGDIAQGTLNLFSFLDPGANFNNQLYTNNLLILLIFLTPHAIVKRKGIWICVLGFLAILMASVWHLFIAFLVAFIIIVLYFSRTFLKLSVNRIVIGMFLICAVTLAIAFQPRNFILVRHYYNVITTFKSPKAKVTINSLVDLPKEAPWVYFIGLGPGQYSSRAGLIGTGKYFGDFINPKKMPVIKPAVSTPFKNHVYPLWEEVSLNPLYYGNSTMARPFYSILSVMIEFGYIIFAILVLLMFRLIRRIKNFYERAIYEKDYLKAFYAISCAVVCLFLVIISFFENYLEVAQAIFIGLLLIKYFYSTVKHTNA